MSYVFSGRWLLAWALWVLLLGFVPIGLAAKPGGGESRPPRKSGSALRPGIRIRGEPIKIGAIVAATGAASFIGAPEKQTLEMLVENVNAAGGLLGCPLELIVKDSQGRPDNAVTFAQQLIEQENVVAIIGPSTSGESMALKDTCEKVKTVLLSCAAADAIVNPLARYVFKTPPNSSCAVGRIYQTMQTMRIKRIGIVTGETGFGKAGSAELKQYAPEYRIQIAIEETFSPRATDLTELLKRVRTAKVDAVLCWSVTPNQILVSRNMKQMGFSVPVFLSHGLAYTRLPKAWGEAANGTIFPASRLLVAELLPDRHPQKKVLLNYKRAYEARYREEVSTFGGHAHDAFTILCEAINQSGSTDSRMIRDAIEGLRGFAGTAGVFNFSAQNHNGLGATSFEILTVREGKFALLGKKTGRAGR